MSKKLFLILFLLVAGINNYLSAQQPQFKLQVDDNIHHFGSAYAIVQDQRGYTWFSSLVKGLIRYDGSTFKSFRHEPEDPNSPASNAIRAIAVDSAGYIWLGHRRHGLDRFDAATNTFTHFRFDKNDVNSLVSDSLFCLMVDHTGKLWVGSRNGLAVFDNQTGKFAKIPVIINGNAIDSSIRIYDVYEDKNGIIWYAASKRTSDKQSGDVGGLARLDPSSGEHTFYKADPTDPESLIDPVISSIFEDSRGNFWVGTRGNGLYTLNRKTGKFTRYFYDPANPGNLSRAPTNKPDSTDVIAFIREDHAGKLWFGSVENGINWYDPETDQLHHYGLLHDKNNPNFSKDTLAGFKDKSSACFITAKDGTSWITSRSGNIYTVSYGSKGIPFFPVENGATSFYMEPNGNILWFGNSRGLIRKDMGANTFKMWQHDPANDNSLSENHVQTIRADENGRLYIGTHYGGLDLFDPATEKFTHIKPLNAAPGSVMDSIHAVCIENNRYLWLGCEEGLARVDRTTYDFTVYRYDKRNEKGIVGARVFGIVKDEKNRLWFANGGGLDRFISESNTFKHYLKGYVVLAVSVDAKGTVWAGSNIGLFHYDESKDRFVQFHSPVFSAGIEGIINIVEDDQHNLWVTTPNEIFRINADRNKVRLIKDSDGILSSNWGLLDNYKAADGRLFVCSRKGYFMFRPEELTINYPVPMLSFSQLSVGGNEVLPGENSILSNPIWKTEKINLDHNQNSFSVDFMAPSYHADEAIRYQYQLENYDVNWNNLDDKHKASFFNIPPGHYTLHVRAINSEGSVSDKQLSIVISPPWWKTWWAYCIYALLIIVAGWQIYLYQKRYIVSRERERSREKELAQAKEIEKAYIELKNTQAQLIQSEKMASLGELTAGIAHEIQNPLNFVNNFSEVNKEMLEELKAERLKPIEKRDDTTQDEIIDDLLANEEKIIHHGKRADAIVKGMLQHSRASSGQKEPTDINALCDEYLRLAYHGLRAKDKSFNATFKTDFDGNIGKMNIVPQDIGRVLLNLINNAFYAVSEKSKQPVTDYQPIVAVSTKKLGDKIVISIKDNGNGIPESIKEKIFQPFFTTKPTGNGTGLGLSLSYDIVKAHSGTLNVEAAVGGQSGAIFIIELPITK